MNNLNKIFDKSLADLVRDIRANRGNEQQFISQALQLIKEEARSPDQNKKTVAVQKLTYLHMLGYDMSWAAFHIIEVMSYQKFTSKRIGYLAASQCFNDETEVLTLATNLIRKDMTSNNVFYAGVAINCLANVCTAELARDLAADVVTLLNSSRPYVRKKAVLVLYKIFVKFPEALRPAFPRLKEKLEDQDLSVVASAVNVICELARKNPKNYISLSPVLYKIMTTSTNNWVLIKIIKLFGALLVIEKRLAKKLVQPLHNLMNTTPAVSLLYECIQTCTMGLSDHLPTMKLCIVKLRTFVEEPDQNLKYLGLTALYNIMQIHPRAVAEHRDLVLNCLDDDDTSIRLRALELIESMVTKKNLGEIIHKLLDRTEKAEGVFRDSLTDKIVSICSKNGYQLVTDFEWYVSVLMQLAYIPTTVHGELLASQMMDVLIRVKVIRPFGIRNMATLLRDPNFLAENLSPGSNCECLGAAAWLVGEFSEFVGDFPSLLTAMTQTRVALLPPAIQNNYIQALLKLYVRVLHKAERTAQGIVDEPADPAEDPAEAKRKRAVVDAKTVEKVTGILATNLPHFAQSPHIEVQERTCFFQEFIALFKEVGGKSVSVADLVALFDDQLNPVAKTAQKKVPMPEGLDLNAWINEPPPDPSGLNGTGADDDDDDALGGHDDDDDADTEGAFGEFDGPEDRAKPGSAAQARHAGNKFYLGGGKAASAAAAGGAEDDSAIQTITEDLGQLEVKPGKGGPPPRRPMAKMSTGKPRVQATVAMDEDMPEGALPDAAVDAKKGGAASAGETSLESIDLTAPLGSEEMLPQRAHRVAKGAAAAPAAGRLPASKQAAGAKAAAAAPAAGAKGLTKAQQDAIAARMAAEAEEKRKAEAARAPFLLGAPAKKAAVGAKTAAAAAPAAGAAPAAAAASAGAASAAAAANTTVVNGETVVAVPVKYKPFVQDGVLAVIYDVRASPTIANKVQLMLAFKNTSKDKTVDSVKLRFAGSPAFKPTTNSALELAFKLAPGASDKHVVVLELADPATGAVAPLHVAGGVAYAANGAAAAEQTFDVALPVTSFVLPIQATKQQFVASLKAAKYSLASTRLKTDKDFKAVIAAVAAALHLDVVSVDDASASLNGRTIAQHRILAYCKNLTATEQSITVDIKATDQTLANSLVALVK